MEKNRIKNIMNIKRAFFNTQATKNIDFRISQLKILKQAIVKYEDKINDALYKDLRKSKFEAYATEIGITIDEINFHIKNLRNWAKPKKKKTPFLIHFYSKSYIYNEPFGHVLIIAPWNYPFQLIISPLIGAMSAGNVITLKPSELSVNTANVIEEMISEFFSYEYISVIQGDKQVSQELLNQKWDYIFFTGSTKIGKIIYQSAAQNLTPVTLELGGKSPVIVDKDANLDKAAKRIIWGKLLNAGQTCIAPDYLFVHKQIKNEFLNKLKFYITSFYGENAEKSEFYTRIINKNNFLRLQEQIKDADIYYGGKLNIENLYFEPTIINNVKPDDKIMQEEIFGPLLPVLEFTELSYVIDFINKRSKPLALYYFSKNKKSQKMVLNKTSSGGSAINEVIMHIANNNLPFGGVGDSGIGKYHGKLSFANFSNAKSVLKKSNLLDSNIRFAPFTDAKYKLMKKIIK
ncbi:MAG: aldehyde dehydrogenase [Bacteroidetes bacterium]|nr:aldehyde dehydrogenase [Bacteroidota bacterium]